MAEYRVYKEQNESEVYNLVQRLCRHHDHLKNLVECYNYMRWKETYARMQDLSFRCNPAKMQELDRSCFTSLIIKLSPEGGKEFFEKVDKVYRCLKSLIEEFDPESKVDIYFDSAHITIKSILDNVKQGEKDLKKYIPIVEPVVQKWIDIFGSKTELFGIGLFTNLHASKGLSIGVRFYPTLPLVQILRGEVGAALYKVLNKIEIPGQKDSFNRREIDATLKDPNKLPLRQERVFHTMLTHSTGFRARNLSFPLHPEFINRFVRVIEGYDQSVFGSISSITSSDVYIRNGYSDKLVPNAEISVGNLS